MDVKRIWLILEGVKLGRIEVLKLADILSNFQRFLFDFGRARNVRKEYMQLYLERIGEGSVEIQVIPPPALTRHLVIDAIEFIEKLKLNLGDPDRAKEILELEYRENERLIIQSLRKLEGFWSYDGSRVNIAFGAEKIEKKIVLSPEEKQNLSILRKEFEKKYSQSISGVLLESKFYGDKRRFEIITPEGKIVKCYYGPSPELEDKVYEYIKKPVTVRGFFERAGRGKIVEVLDLEGWNEALAKEFAGYRLKKPIPIRVSYDNIENIWCLENEDLELYGCGTTFEEAKKDLEIVFKTLIEGYALEEDRNLSEKAIELKKKLLEFVEVEKIE
ncbi:MAG: hypothetical protein QXF06_05035 [Archaeoglobaceae archaeon]